MKVIIDTISHIKIGTPTTFSNLTWLKGRNLVIDLVEQNKRAREVNSVVLRLFQAIGDSGQEAMARQYRRAKSIPLRLNRSSRKAVRAFADFCERSGGFRVQ